MKSKFILGIMMLVFFYLGNSVSSFANVYATNLKANTTSINPLLGQTVELSYRLNESADLGVIVEIYNARDQLVCSLNGGTDRGVNTVVWNGKDNSGVIAPKGNYYFIVSAADVGHATWEMISLDEPGNVIYSGRGIDVNKNPESPFYGMVYVSNSATGTSTNPGAVQQYDGVYSYWPDGTLVAAFNDTIHFNKKSGNSPFRTNVGDDDRITIADYSDGWENLWAIDADLKEASLVQILARDDTDPATPPAGNHGNALTAIVKGIGANRVLYITDEDFTSSNYDVWSFAINNGPFPYTSPATLLITESDNMADIWDFDINRSGSYLYACDDQDATNPLNPTPLPSFSKWDLTTNPPTCIWSSPTTKVVHNIDGIGYCERNNTIAGSCKKDNPIIFIMDATTGALVDTVINPGGGRNRDVAIDDAGNLYVVNSSIEWWRAFSPPNRSNSFATKSVFHIEIATAVEDKENVVGNFELSQCYPNPFNPTTTIHFYLPRNAEVALTIINLNGETVRNLATGWLPAGNHSITWDGRNQSGDLMPSGIYLYQLRAGKSIAQKKMILSK